MHESSRRTRAAETGGDALRPHVALPSHGWRASPAGRKHATIASVAFAFLFAAAGTAWAADDDSDGLTNEEEAVLGTDPYDDDSDDDGLLDGAEITEHGTNPLDADTDGDTYSDSAELTNLTDPLIPEAADPDGGSNATFTGAPTGTPWAWAGTSPMDAIGVYPHSGAMVFQLASLAPTRGLGMGFSIDVLHNTHSAYDGFVGFGNSSILDTKLTELISGDVQIVLPEDGVERTFTWNSGSGTFTSPVGCTCILVKIDTDIFERSFPTSSCGGGVQTYRYENGLLVEMSDRFGNTVTFNRTGNLVTSVTDTRGETYSLSYYDTDRLESVTAPDGATWTLEYNVAGQLYRVLGPATTSFTEGIDLEYHYINGSTTGSLNGNLSVAIDGRGQSWLRNVFDTSDRVEKQFVGGTGGAHFAFNYENAASQSVAVLDRAGNARVWYWNSGDLAKARLTEKTNRDVRDGEGDYDTYWTSDGNGYILEVEYPRGNGVEYTLNEVWLPTEIRRKTVVDDEDDEDDLVETYTYDDEKFYGVLSHTDAMGHTTTYTLNSFGQPTLVTLPEVDGDEDPVTNAYGYNGNGTVASFTDAEGKVTTYAYYTSGPRKGRLQTKTVDDGGLDLATTWDYEAWGDVKSVTDPRGNTTTYTVERYGNVEEIEAPAPLGYVTQYDHDGNLNVVEKRVRNIDWDGEELEDPDWWVTTYGYSAMNKVISETEDVTDETTRSTVYTYDANDNLSVVERAPRMTQMVYDERDLLTTRKQVGANGDPTTTYTYDGNRNTVLVKNPRLKETTFTFDLFDRNTAVTGPMGHWTERVHDEDGRVTETKSWEAAGDPGPTGDTLLAHHKDHYDERGRRWKEEDALLGESTTWVEREYGFDLRGLVTLVTDRRGKETAYTHDGAGRLLTTTDELGNVTENEYDENGNVIAVEETEWNPVAENTATFRTEFTYDVLNRRITQKVIDNTNGSNFKLTQWKHAVLGLRKTIDPLENEVELILDGLGRTVEKREDLGSSQAVVTKWTYNAFDQVTQLLDDNEHATDYAYNYVGRLVSKTYEKPDPEQEDPPTVTYEHDANGNVTEITDQNGSVFAQAFDDLDRLTTRAIDVGPGVGGGDASEAFAYDGLGRLLEAEDDDSTVQLTYDSLSRVLTEVQGGNPLGAEARTTTYAWDEEGNRTEVGYPSGFEAHETRDDLGRTSQIKDGSNVTVATFLNHGTGLRRAKTVFANGGYEALSYDGFRRPTSIAHKDSGNSQFAGFAYAWDKNDNPLMEKRSHRSGSGDVYSYDKINRLTRVLTAVVDPEGELADPDSEVYVRKLQYNMDDVFNLTSYVVTPYGDSPVTTNYTTDALNQYTDIGAAELTYTAAGSLEDDGTRTYTYDAHQHLIAVHEGETPIATYTYDALGLGRRTSKTVSGTTTRYVYAGQQSVEEYEDGDLARLFVFGDRIDQVVMMEAPDYGDVDDDENLSEVFRFSFHGQLLGSVTHVTGPGGSLVEQYEYDPYGKPTIKDAGGDPLGASAIKNPYLYTGRQLDEETGLYYYRARMYSSEMRRFVQRDPREAVDGVASAHYVRAAPTYCLDPSGCIEIDWSPPNFRPSQEWYQNATNYGWQVSPTSVRDLWSQEGEEDSSDGDFTRQTRTTVSVRVEIYSRWTFLARGVDHKRDEDCYWDLWSVLLYRREYFDTTQTKGGWNPSRGGQRPGAGPAAPPHPWWSFGGALLSAGVELYLDRKLGALLERRAVLAGATPTAAASMGPSILVASAVLTAGAMTTTSMYKNDVDQYAHEVMSLGHRRYAYGATLRERAPEPTSTQQEREVLFASIRVKNEKCVRRSGGCSAWRRTTM